MISKWFNGKAGRAVGPMVLIAALVVALLPGVAAAAPLGQKDGDAIAITYGEIVSGVITDDEYEIVYTFEGAAGDVVSVEMNRLETTLDPFVILDDAMPYSDPPLAFDDDGGGERDSLISAFTLPANGTYYIFATRFALAEGTSTGGYTLTLSEGAAMPEETSGGAFGGLPVGEGDGGGDTPQTSPDAQAAFACDGVSVPAASLVTFRDVRPGFSYRVTVLGLDGFDPVIALEAEDGSGICNDDAPGAASSLVEVPGVGLVTGSALTAQIDFTTSGAVGDIVMRIGGYGGVGGRYVAVFEGLAISPAAEQDEAIISVTPSIQDEPLLVYMISETAALDSYMQLPQLGLICDDAGVGPCADVPGFTGSGVAIANGGTYVAGPYDSGIGIIPGGTGDFSFQFQSYNGATTGNYAMIVIGASPGADGSAPAQSGGAAAGATGDIPTLGGHVDDDFNLMPVIAYGDTVRNTITDTNWAWGYAFQGQAGDSVVITADAEAGGDFDPYIVLLNEAEDVVAEDDDSGDGFNALLQYELPTTGTYYIAITRYTLENPGPVGGYVMSLNVGTAPTTGGADAGGADAGGADAGGAGAAAGTMDFNLAPLFGSADVVSGFQPDPQSYTVTAGGPVDVQAAVGSVCNGTPRGYVTAAPSFSVNYTAGQYVFRLLFVGDGGDTTMVVNAPDGTWYCDDDSAGLLQPMLTFGEDGVQPVTGRYDVWVGSYSGGEVAGTLYVTEMDIDANDF